MNRGHKMCLKRKRAESSGCHDRHPLPRVCLREPGSRDVINWQWRYVTRAQMICYRNNRYLHDVPECLSVKNCPAPSGLPIPVANKIQNAIQYKDRSLDWWCLAHTMTREREAVATDFLRWPYATPSGGGFDTPIRYMGSQILCLTDCIEICPYFSRTTFWFWHTK